MESHAKMISEQAEGIAPEAGTRRVSILMADDDEDDCLLFQEALKESCLKHNLRCFPDGQKLMDYLRGSEHHEAALTPRPDLIILDLNMPIKDGRAALQEIKQDPRLKDIHVMVLTESREESDLMLCYKLGAETFLTKEEWLNLLVDVIRTSGDYWFDFVCPGNRRNGSTESDLN
jgi:CheY-like chemotaxis protein